METLLRLTSISKSFGGVHALKGVSFDLQRGRGPRAGRRERRGQIHADQGHHRRPRARRRHARDRRRARRPTIRPAASRARSASPRSTSSRRCSPTSPSPRTSPCASSAAGRGGCIRWGERRRRAASCSRRVGADDLAGRARPRPVDAAAAARRDRRRPRRASAKVLILDEPTASLSDREVGEPVPRHPRAARRRASG